VHVKNWIATAYIVVVTGGEIDHDVAGVVEKLRGETGDPAQLAGKARLPAGERSREPHLLDKAVQPATETVGHG
jgi:hypothetical protein